MNIQDTLTNIAKDTSKEEKFSKNRKERIEGRKQGRLKEKIYIEATYQTQKPS